MRRRSVQGENSVSSVDIVGGRGILVLLVQTGVISDGNWMYAEHSETIFYYPWDGASGTIR